MVTLGMMGTNFDDVELGGLQHKHEIASLTLRRLMSYIYIWSTHS